MNAPKTPQLLLKNKKSEIYQSNNNIKKYLLMFGDFKNINNAKSILGVSRANEVYETLLQGWNEYVDAENKIIMNKYKKEFKKHNDNQAKRLQEELNKKARAVVKQKKEKKEQIKLIVKERKQNKSKNSIEETIMIEVQLEIVYTRTNKDGTIKYSNPYLVERTISSFKINQQDKTNDNITTIIQHKIDDFKNPYKIVKLMGYKIVVMDTNVLQEKYKKPRSKVMMKNAFILKNDWLSYSKGIIQEAYDDSDDKCVYYQLEKFLLNPPTGNPTKFVNKQRTSQDALYEYFNEINVEEEKFNIKSGVSTEMIAKLCKDIKRNMYAYDEDNKCFYNVLCNDSKNYCPIVFYCMNGHFYLINDPKCIRSVAESNKPTAKKIKTSSLENEQEEKDFNEVFHIDCFDIVNAKQMNKGIYILQQSNLEKEIIEFITYHGDMVRTKNRDNVVIQITFKNEQDENVVICVDTNYGQNIEYNKIKNVANRNGMEYTNEGVGSVIMKVLENRTKTQRITFTDEERSEIINIYDGKCAMCNEVCSKYEIDHISPLACGGTNELDNLQPLCIDCHKQKTKEENEMGIYKVNDEISSTFNDKVLKQIVTTSHFKSWQFVEKVADMPEEFEAFKIDMNKCRRNLMYYSKFEFPVYSIMDTPKEFKGRVRCGMFYVNTSNVFPFRGCGWYFEPLVKYGIDNKLITIDDILYEFIPYKTLSNDYFKKHIDILLDAFSCEKDLQKLCINAFIGLMGITKRKVCYSKYSLCPYTASAWYVNQNKNVFIKNHPLSNGEVLYQGIFSEEVLNETSQYCIYSMVLQLEALELHKMETIILHSGSIVLDRNTDAIRYASKIEIDILPYYYDEENKVSKYKPETPTELHVEHLPKLQRKNIEFDFNSNWNIEYGYNRTATEKAQDIINTNKSIHIDGRAGCGKTYLVNEIIKLLKDKKHIGFSPTNKGARLINGSTIHSMYHKFKRCKTLLFNVLEKVDYIFIDEVSMMIEKFYTLFIMIKRALPHINFVISGDFGQLPPVNDSWVGDYENSEALWFLCDGNRLQLTEFRRGDKELFLLCRDVENVDVDNFKPTEKTYLNLAYTHRTRIRVNNECMERYLTENNKPFTLIERDIKNEKTQDVKLCVGMPVIAHTTDKKKCILNSQKFIIKQIKNGKLTLIDEDREIEIDIKMFHKYFYLGFCITIHASQGETFTQPYTIYDWNFKHFCHKAKYVALSRATSIKNIQIVCSNYGNNYDDNIDFDYFDGECDNLDDNIH